MKFKKATFDDLSELMTQREKVILAVFGVQTTCVMSETLSYLTNHFEDQVTILVYDDDNQIIACGSICFYSLLPTPVSPRNKKAYVMNMFTDSTHRRKGIATKILELLITEASIRKISEVGLDASELGRKVYESYGFVARASDEMIYFIK